MANDSPKQVLQLYAEDLRDPEYRIRNLYVNKDGSKFVPSEEMVADFVATWKRRCITND